MLLATLLSTTNWLIFVWWINLYNILRSLLTAQFWTVGRLCTCWISDVYHIKLPLSEDTGWEGVFIPWLVSTENLYMDDVAIFNGELESLLLQQETNMAGGISGWHTYCSTLLMRLSISSTTQSFSCFTIWNNYFLSAILIRLTVNWWSGTCNWCEDRPAHNSY